MLGVSIVLFVVLLAVLFAVAAVTAGFGDLMRPVFQDARPVGLPATRISPDDLEALRFNVVLRGYKMTEVDAVLHRMAREIAERDAVLAELRGEGRPVSFRPPASGDAPTELLLPYSAPLSTVPDEDAAADTAGAFVDHDADTDEHEAVPDRYPEGRDTLPDAASSDDAVEAVPGQEPTEALPGYHPGDATSALPAFDDRMGPDESGRVSDEAERPAPPVPPADPS